MKFMNERAFVEELFVLAKKHNIKKITPCTQNVIMDFSETGYIQGVQFEFTNGEVIRRFIYDGIGNKD